ncbi:MAG TPA: SCO family protein [Pyrinomonadaceae bacterium]|nr:SCO family protein [Pyrinomonadaceae bacterium]
MKSIQHSYTWAMLTLVLLIAATVHAQEPTAPPQTVVPNTQENNAQRYFTDTVLINQNGERVRFYTDLMKDKTVIIDTFFATCQASCLPMNRNLAQIQEGLGDRLGKDVNILSISVDPGVDTPTLLKAYAKKLNAKPGWYFLTGDKESIEFILKKLGQFVDDKNDHLNIFLIGNNRTGLWKKAFGLAKSEELMKVVESVVNDPGTAAKP